MAGSRGSGASRRDFIDDRACGQIEARGPLSAGELEDGGRGRRAGAWWGWSDGKRALEWLFWAGPGHDRDAARLRAGLRPDRARPAPMRSSRAPTPDAEEAQRALLRHAGAGARRSRASAACATISASTSRTRGAPCRTRRGRRAPVPVTVEGWKEPVYLDPAGADPAPHRGAGARLAVRSPRLGAHAAPSGCSTSATGSRSTRRPRSASSAITACPSSSATASSPASTSRPTGPANGSSSIPFTRKRASRPATSPRPFRAGTHAARRMAQA